MRRSFILDTLFFSLILLLGCQTSEKAPHSPFHPAISAFTSGQISVQSPIMIELASPVPQALAGELVPDKVISFSPSIKGSATWSDNRTILFKPSGMLPSGQSFKCEVNLPRLLPDEDESFFFTFQTIPQNVWITTELLGPKSVNDNKQYEAIFNVVLADAADNKMVERFINIDLEGKKLTPNWTHIDGRNHRLAVDGIDRKKKEQTLTVTVEKGELSSQQKKQHSVIIPSIDTFKILSARFSASPRKIISVTFSDPVDPAQNISGLFRLSDQDLNWSIDKNIVELYPDENMAGEQTLVISPDIKSLSGQKLNGRGEFTFSFSTDKPAVEIIGDGTIIPGSDGWFLPFRAVSLKAVRIRIIKIYEHNIGHFLQINRLNGENQLKRAGRLVHKQTILLDTDPTRNLLNWNTFSLDLSRFIQPDPGAIYRVELGFKKSDAILPCNDNTETSKGDTDPQDPEEGFWDDADNYYAVYPYYYGPNYRWTERNDPCSESYYTRERWVARNVLASNLGLMVKAGTNRQLLVTATDLITAGPLQKVDIDVFNLQMVKIGGGTTGKDGQVWVETEGIPFLLVAKQGKQRGYLRLDEGQALPNDRFDVSGEAVKKGLRGFIFGERGVWRPGDSIFISFMPLESEPGTLPAGHPVTFELTDPRGRLVHRQTQAQPNNRLYTFRTKTDNDSPTGFWLARILVGGITFEKSLRIETFRPNRLKVQLITPDGILNSGTTSKFKINSAWLHGSPAKGLKTDVHLHLRKAKTLFENYNDFLFDDPTRTVNESELTIFEGTLDAKGQTDFEYQIPRINRAPGMLNGIFSMRVFEKSGAFSVGSKPVIISPYEIYTGIRPPKGDERGMLLTDQDHKIEVVTLDEMGQSVGQQQLQYTIYKINWRWWWEKTDEDLGRYISSNSRNIIARGTVTTNSNGTGHFNFRINQPDWGRYLIRLINPASGHSTAATIQVDWPGWARESRGGDGASQLLFSADKSAYQVGEQITVTFPSTEAGRALVSIESGSKILKTWWVDPQPKETTFSFEASPEMVPNIYVNITLIQPFGQTANDRPLRLYGIIPIMVNDPDTRLEPTLKTSVSWQPGEEAVIEVSEAKNREMSYVLAVVDEGLLDITNHATPDPWVRFNARQALGVKTWDLFDDVLGAFGGKIEQIFSVGGDLSLIGDKGKRTTQRFEPMVKFFGPYQLRKKGKMKHQFKVPSYTGSVRVMLIATNGKATGSTDAVVTVKKPLMVWAAMPRLMGPDEKLSLPVTIFVSDNNIKDVTVAVSGSNHFSVGNNGKQRVSFDTPGEKTLFFEVSTNSAIGASQLVIEASAKGFKDRIIKQLDIRLPNPPVTQTLFEVIKPGTTKNLPYNLPGMKGTNTLKLEAGNIPAMNLAERLNFLIQYPHGCLEQIVSGAFPQLYLSKITDLSDTLQKQTRTNIASVLGRLATYQTTVGGLAYWPGQSQPNDWASSYAGHFMLEAEKEGYPVQPRLKKAWLKWQRERASLWLPRPETPAYPSEQMIQAYRLFTLALAGEPATAAMNRLRQQDNLIPQARWLLADAYALSGMSEVAQTIIDQAPKISSIDIFPQTYGSSLRDKAILIYTLNLLNRKEEALPLVQETARALSSEHWYSTQTTAWSLMSVIAFAGNHTRESSLQFSYSINGGETISIGSDKPLSQRDLLFNSVLNGNIEVSNLSDKELFVTLMMNGTPGGIDTAEWSENLIIERRFVTLDNQPVNPLRIEQGTDIKYIVRVTNPGSAGDASHLALTSMMPSGWEIRNTRLEGIHLTDDDLPDYRDIRDDRVLTYFNLPAGQSKQFVVVVHAAFPGTFYLPPVSVEDMYNHTIRARTQGATTTVVAP
ncbi:MG2 domain-containing protein [Thermophagus sp. OGC60D27]|uniref:alpha-2-macroglobulin family protein n=1 Tax=Thermophagus sp. OGC60D27 TaxID=3458415 RepID=UPI004037863B